MSKSQRSTSAGISTQDAAYRPSLITPQIRVQAAGAPPVQQTVKVVVVASSISLYQSPRRQRYNKGTPNLTFREVPYDVWRKHYAKDKDGYYQGTHTPAEDCLLNPEDVRRWRLEEPRTNADLYTRGREVLPAYEETKLESNLPEYTQRTEKSDNTTRVKSLGQENQRTSTFTADGKTAEEIIREAKEKALIKKSRKEQWRDFRRGAEISIAGNPYYAPGVGYSGAFF